MRLRVMPVSLVHTRQNFRLPGYDYSAEGNYFITICTDQKIFHFGAIFDNVMVLNDIGRIAEFEWFKLADRYPNIHLGPFCVMPNHIHGIIQITPIATSSSPSSSPYSFFDGLIPVGAGLAPAHADIADNADNANNSDNADNAKNADNANNANNADNAINADNAKNADNDPLLITGIRAGASPGIRAGASPAPTTEQLNPEKEGKGEKVTLGSIVGAYKSLVMTVCLAGPNNPMTEYPVIS